MKISDCVKMSFSDLKKRKLRTALTALGISVGAMLIIIMAGLGQGIQQISSDKLKEIDTMKVITVNPQTNTKKPEFKKIDENVLAKLSKIKGVSTVTASVNTIISQVKIGDKTAQKVSVRGNNLNYPIFTSAEQNDVKSDKEKVEKYGYNTIIQGRTLNKDENSSVLVGQMMLDKMGIKDYKSVVGKNMEIKVSLPNVYGIEQKQSFVRNVKIVGVVNKVYENGRNTIVTSDKIAADIQKYYMNENNYLNNKGYDMVQVEANSISDVKKVDDAIKKMGYSDVSSIEYAEKIDDLLSILQALLIASGVIVLLVASIGVINTMTMAVYEKKKSIGIMKAQGASRKDIRRMFTVQSGSIGLIGGIFGAVIALILGVVINNVVVMYNIGGIESGMKIVDFKVSVILLTMLFTILVSMIAALIPARKAAKLDPVDSLRCE
ncbi:ABC transporter permease [Clostridium sp. cel8]|jgi:putative ABC transport system permease protein|uniref:ABC transporter permease n=1 Tax=unclassified Clostridium TaxID=2614128 RepID=UPI0015F3951A|nr:FtsX-like permease family protein [Clostridium sp. cel8]MBA5850226.1 ABC transporter permease [Clostridium sp. cel8]